MPKTVVQLEKNTVDLLKKHKKYARQTYDELIRDLIQQYDEEPLSPEELEELQAGLEDLRKGRVKPLEQVARELKITLK